MCVCVCVCVCNVYMRYVTLKAFNQLIRYFCLMLFSFIFGPQYMLLWYKENLDMYNVTLEILLIHYFFSSN